MCTSRELVVIFFKLNSFAKILRRRTIQLKTFWYMTCVFSMNERCDQIIQCQDESDEDDCSLLVFKESYNKLVPPISFNQADSSIIPVSIRVSTSLRNVLEISEFTHTIDLKLGITLEWYDNRVLYHNLKSEEALNVLSKSEVYLSYMNLNIFLKFFSDEFFLDSLHNIP